MRLSPDGQTLISMDINDIQNSVCVIPNSVTRIGKHAFKTSHFTEVIIPSSVTHIDDSAFFECTNLTNILIPNSVTHIGEAAFFGCSGLTEVIIPNSVTHIGEAIFSRCKNLRVIMIEALNAQEHQRIQNLLPRRVQYWVIPFDFYQEIKKAKSLEFISLRNEDIYLPLRRLPTELINLVFQFEGCLHNDINNVQLPIVLDEFPMYREDLKKAHIQCIQQQNTSFQNAIVIHKLQKVIDWTQQEISSKEQIPGFFSNPTNAALKIEREARIAVISKLIRWLSGDKNETFSEEDIALLKVRSVMEQFNLEDLPQAPAHRILDEENLEEHGLYISRTMQVTAAGFFSGGAVMGATLYLSSAAQAFVMNLLPFLSMTASMCTAVVACGIAMALLALVVHMAMNHTAELNAAIDLNVP